MPDDTKDSLVDGALPAAVLAGMTEKRWALIARLVDLGPTTVRGLATALGRDYKNIHTNVANLEALGIVQRTEDDKVFVPWKEIIFQVQLQDEDSP